MSDRSIFSCPQCGLPLDEAADRYVCANRHAFDRGRSGYVNLRQTARRGDTGPMLHARRRFLERGFFQPISDAINAIVVDHLKHLAASGGNEAIIDVGCGDGYYLRRLSRRLETTPFECLPLVGLDASKHAARLTAAGLRGRRCAVVDAAVGR